MSEIVNHDYQGLLNVPPTPELRVFDTINLNFVRIIVQH